MAYNTNWLNLVQEKPLEPKLPICDPHHHLWEFRHERVAHRYLLEEILEDVQGGGHNIVSTVFIECGAMYRKSGPKHMRCIGETEFVNGVAAMAASGLYGKTQVAAGIVGTADLTRGCRAGAVLDAQIVAGGGPKGRFKGIRHSASWDADPIIPKGRLNPGKGLYLDKTFREGFAELAPRNLSFEGWCYHHTIPDLTDLAKAFPDTTIILNHFGGPLGIGPYEGQQDEIFKTWRKDITELSKCPNVVAKLGGLNMEMNGFGFQHRPLPPTSDELVAAYRRYFEHTIDKFGPDRCMFESNFPVDMVSCSYTVLWNANKKMAKGASAKEKAALFHDTATRIYKL